MEALHITIHRPCDYASPLLYTPCVFCYLCSSTDILLDNRLTRDGECSYLFLVGGRGGDAAKLPLLLVLFSLFCRPYAGLATASSTGSFFGLATNTPDVS